MFHITKKEDCLKARNDCANKEAIHQIYFENNMKHFFPFFVSLFAIACDDHKFTGGHSTTIEGASEAENLISTKCVSCHASGGNFPDLSGDLCDLDGVASSIGMPLLTLGNSDESYLFHKVDGTVEDVGGTGSTMPLGGTLSEAEIQIIGDWINTDNTCSSTDPSEIDVASLISTKCVSCHASGGTFPDLSVELCDLAAVTASQVDMPLITLGNPDESYLFHKVSGTAGDVGGNASTMPLGGTLSEAEIQAISNWISTDNTCPTTEPDPIVGSAANGEVLFNELPPSAPATSCASCHGNLNPTDTYALASIVPTKTAEQISTTIKNGVGYAMPSFEAHLTEQNIADIVAFLQSKFPN